MIELTLNGQEKDLGGGFVVRRLLPAAARRSVGPFIFFDHFGPVTETPGRAHDVRPHPHIGLATVTYLFEGAMMHRDSIGSTQLIEPGAINWMTAGRGIVHSERKPDTLVDATYAVHGLQLWTALPLAHEEDEPSFAHTPAAEIPQVDLARAQVRVLVGSAFGATSPVKAFSQTLYLDVKLEAGAAIELPALVPEMALYPVQGDLVIDAATLPARTMAVLHAGAATKGPCAAPGPLRRDRRRAAGCAPAHVVELRVEPQGAHHRRQRRLARDAHGPGARRRRIHPAAPDALHAAGAPLLGERSAPGAFRLRLRDLDE